MSRKTSGDGLEPIQFPLGRTDPNSTSALPITLIASPPPRRGPLATALAERGVAPMPAATPPDGFDIAIVCRHDMIEGRDCGKRIGCS